MHTSTGRMAYRELAVGGVLLDLRKVGNTRAWRLVLRHGEDLAADTEDGVEVRVVRYCRDLHTDMKSSTWLRRERDLQIICEYTYRAFCAVGIEIHDRITVFVNNPSHDVSVCDGDVSMPE